MKQTLDLLKERVASLQDQMRVAGIEAEEGPQITGTFKQQIELIEPRIEALEKQLTDAGHEPVKQSQAELAHAAIARAAYGVSQVAEKPKAAAPATAPPASAPATAPASAATPLENARTLLSQYSGKSGSERSAFFRANETALFAASELVEKADAPPPTKPDAAEIEAAQNLLAQYGALRGREKTAMLRTKEAELFAASRLLENQ